MRPSHPEQGSINDTWWRRVYCAIRAYLCGTDLTPAQKARIEEMEKDYEKFKADAGGRTKNVL